MSTNSESNANKVEELLADWELLRLEGKELSPEELAHDYPELLEEVRAEITALRATLWVIEDSHEVPDSIGWTNLSGPLPDSPLSVDEFVAALKETGISAPDAIQQVIDDEGGDRSSATARDLAIALIKQGALTRYQARTLLSGGINTLLLDRYLILDVIGAGGMGLVFKRFTARWYGLSH